MLRFSITSLILLTVWIALLLNAKLNSNRLRDTRLRTKTALDESTSAEDQNRDLQQYIKNSEPAYLRTSALIETGEEIEQRLVEAFREYTSANRDVRPVPGMFSIRKIPLLPVESEIYRYEYQVFLPDRLTARLQFDLQPLPIDIRPDITDFQGIDIGKPLSIPLQSGQNRLSLVYQPKQDLPDLPQGATESGATGPQHRQPLRDQLASKFRFTVATGQEKWLLMETDGPTRFRATDPSGLDSYEQVELSAGNHSLWSGSSSGWPFRLEAKLVIEEAANE